MGGRDVNLPTLVPAWLFWALIALLALAALQDAIMLKISNIICAAILLLGLVGAVIAGPQVSLADFAAAAHLSALDYVGDIDWSLNEAAKDWYARCKSRPSFRALLAERVSGITPPAHYADLDF